jgi:DNA-binding GntR family transcriptional regulator
MRKLTPEEIARLEQLRREGEEFRERWDAKMRRWQEREESRRRFVRRILRLGLPG